MALTSEALTALHADILANASVATLIEAGDDAGIADIYNQQIGDRLPYGNTDTGPLGMLLDRTESHNMHTADYQWFITLFNRGTINLGDTYLLSKMRERLSECPTTLAHFNAWLALGRPVTRAEYICGVPTLTSIDIANAMGRD